MTVDDETAVTGTTASWRQKQTLGKVRPDIDVDKVQIPIRAMGEDEREETYMNTARQQKVRIQRIRQARGAAETIQRAWRKYKKL